MRGTSLMEALVSIAIIGLLFAVAGTFAVAARRAFDIALVRARVEEEAAIGLEPIRDAGKAARKILDQQIMFGTLYQTSSSTLVLELPTFDATGAPVASSSDYVAFTRDQADPTRVLRAWYAAPLSGQRSGTVGIARLVADLRFFFASTTPAGAPAFEALLATSSTVRGQSVNAVMSSFVTLQNP